jgi:hypothetical protein
MNSNPTPRELADEALQILRETQMSPEEHFEFLIRQGIIDRNGRVLVCKLFGTETSDEANGTPAPPSASEKSAS